MPDLVPVASRPSRDRHVYVVGALVLAALSFALAWQLRFLCDDAFITFRYVSNAHDGHGLVWNPAPFAPVEGYTGFSWALLLWAAWSWFGVAPPDSVHAMSIACGLGLFVVVAVAVRRVGDPRRPLPALAALLVLLAVAQNRTFVTWWTGGLETALFELAFVGWVVLAFRRTRTPGTWAAWSATAAVAALTRPDGLLLCAATVGVALLVALRRDLTLRSLVLGLSPLGCVLLHVAWRLWFYGEWLPNTYYAKVTAPWPEAGARYVACFLVEHGGYVWLGLAVLWLAVELRRSARRFVTALIDNLPAVAAVLVVIFHAAYYAVRVGGDPFEYRIVSQLVPLGALATAAMGASIGGVRAAVVSTSVLLVASQFGWLHHVLHEPTLSPFYQPIEAKAPAPLRPLVRWHDRQQAWLHVQVLCGRRQEHAMFLAEQERLLPQRERRSADPADIPMAAFTGVGLAGWVLPDVAILDLLGLNDWVIARTPIGEKKAPLLPKPVIDALLATADVDGDGRYTRGELRAPLSRLPGAAPQQIEELVGFLLLVFGDEDPESLTRSETLAMEPFFTGMRFSAHERLALQDYVDAFAPNATVEDRHLVVRPRSVPLTGERVRSIEADWRQRSR